MEQYIKHNFHTHTTRCHHAVGEDREYVEAAIEAGLKTLGFSDHIPLQVEEERISGIRMDFSQVEQYVDSLLKLRDEYKKQIDIAIGFEGEYYPPYFQEQMERLDQYPVDYIILGQHFLPWEGDWIYTGWATEKTQILKDYVDTCIEGLQTGRYAYLCHPDLVQFTGEDVLWEKEMRRLMTYCKKENVPLEMNLLGYLEQRWYPSDRFLALAGEVGNTMILGIDAHSPEQIGKKEPYQKALEKIKAYHLQVIDEIKRNDH